VLNDVLTALGRNWKEPPKVHDRLPALERKYDLIEKFLPEYKAGGKSVLDLSCGNGALLEILRHYGNEVAGSEVEYFLYLKSQAIPFVRHDCAVFPYPFEDQSFDLVSCIGSISFYRSECAPVLLELFRIARKTVFVLVNTGEYLDTYGPELQAFCPDGWRKTLNAGSVYKWEKP
jgi:SAM-dependent methyltransferase